MNQNLQSWVKEMEHLCKPKKVHFCDGSLVEYERLCALLTQQGTFTRLDERKRPGSYWCRSHPDDVARVEESTFICSQKQEDAGPTNNWVEPSEMRDKLLSLFAGCMRGRVMYVIPFCMGPLGSPLSQIGVQITDSPYVVVNMRIMTRMGDAALKELQDRFFIPCMHSVGVPLKEGESDSFWPCNSKERCIAHFPEEKEIWSFGSGYGGNALLGKKCLALRIASSMGRSEGWMAEHMLIMGLTNPEGEKIYLTAAFPSACGKTNLAMLQSTLPGWHVECVGDDIAWMKFGEDGRLYAINPEAGFFGVAPGTSLESNPSAMETIASNTIFTNVAYTPDGDVWWEGMTETAPPHLTDWRGEPWTPSSKTPAAHPNARFTAPASQCPVMDPAWNDPKGVPISGIIFGGRRASNVPLVFESFSWQHGVFIGASVSSEMTAAAKGAIGAVRHDPFSMLPFCGYHMGDYFGHWLEMGLKRDPSLLPKIFHVNWFRKGSDGTFLWPGFGENGRVLKWIAERIQGKGAAVKTAIGFVPAKEALDLSGLSLAQGALNLLLQVDGPMYLKEVQELENFFSLFGAKLPEGIQVELSSLHTRLETC